MVSFDSSSPGLSHYTADMRLNLKVTFVSHRIKLIKAAKLMSLSSFKLIGKMRENKIRKDEKKKRHFMSLMKVAQF